MADAPGDEAHAEGALDRLDVLRILRASDDDERSRALERIGEQGRAEQELIAELSVTTPVHDVVAFELAHRHLMHAFEVLDRNGARAVTVPRRLGPLRPVVASIVQIVTRWIVKSHLHNLASRVRRLYEQREASAPWGSTEHHALRRARIGATRVETGIRPGSLGLPTALLGGAFLSGTLSAGASGLESVQGNLVPILIIAGVVAVLLGSLSWVILYAAAIARRRIRLATDLPIAELYAAIGAAGEPPRDQSYNLAVLAIVLIVVAIVLVPAGAWLIFEIT